MGEIKYELKSSIERVKRKLESWITEGKQIRDREIRSNTDLSLAHGDKQRWRNEVRNNISTLFKDKRIGFEFYDSFKSQPEPPFANFEFQLNRLKNGLYNGIKYLEYLLDKVLFDNEDKKTVNEGNIKMHPSIPHSNEIFIVHGHDSDLKERIARFISKIGLNPIILHEKPSKGKTIIEKFHDYSNVSFAIVLLTPDDVGASKSDFDNLTPRARQNVIFEFGFFIGKLGRDKVCGIISNDIDLPSDYSGVIYIKLDQGDSWKTNLIKELKAAGYDIDANVMFEG